MRTPKTGLGEGGVGEVSSVSVNLKANSFKRKSVDGYIIKLSEVQLVRDIIHQKCNLSEVQLIRGKDIENYLQNSKVLFYVWNINEQGNL